MCGRFLEARSTADSIGGEELNIYRWGWELQQTDGGSDSYEGTHEKKRSKHYGREKMTYTAVKKKPRAGKSDQEKSQKKKKSTTERETEIRRGETGRAVSETDRRKTIAPLRNGSPKYLSVTQSGTNHSEGTGNGFLSVSATLCCTKSWHYYPSRCCQGMER